MFCFVSIGLVAVAPLLYHAIEWLHERVVQGRILFDARHDQRETFRRRQVRGRRRGPNRKPSPGRQRVQIVRFRQGDAP